LRVLGRSLRGGKVMRRRGEGVVLYEMMMVMMRFVVYKPEMASAVAGWPIGGIDATSFWKVGAAVTVIPIDRQKLKSEMYFSESMSSLT
jgi:hypothetical protein